MATTKTTTPRKTSGPSAKKAAKPREKKVEAKAETLSASEARIYAMDGSQKGTVKLPENLFNVKWNADLVHQVVVGMQANARNVIAHTKHRGEVRGGGKKPWKQKGTGRARHGSSRSPIWKGGGVTHGPRNERVFEVKINKKMRRAAFLSVLSRKAKDGEVIFIEKLAMSVPKTKDAKSMLTAVAKAAGANALVAKHKNAAIVAFSEPNDAVKKSFRNIGNIALEEVRNLNPVDLMTNRYLVIENPEKAFELLSARAN
ncbi:MAG TPA: 50S ribosomal protein L4 [Candidatus Paceibacterota bacterium]|nr:50S ribosomal protein L4 [Candidatus Paceibacterota bacterium]